MNLPIKKNFREGLTITDYLMSGYGARKGIVDTALKTANSGYLTRRLIDVSQDILIREKDCFTNHSFLVSSKNFTNQNTVYEKILGRVINKDVLDPSTNLLIASKNTQLTPQLVKKLVEWEVTQEIQITGFTAGGGITGSTFYNGNVKLYSLLPKDQTKTTVINMDTPLDEYKSGPEYTLEFTGQTLENGVKIVNQFISGVNNGKINVQGYQQFPFENDTQLTNQFPFYFRPTKNNIDKLASTGATNFNMVNNFFRKIKLLPSDKQFGSVLVWSKNLIGEQLTPETSTLRQSVYNPNPVSYGTLAADFVYFLSHKSDIPSKQKIVLEPKETLYGIPQQIFTENIINNTDPMVRGNELMKLLTLIVNFLASHVHNINEAPIQIGVDGTQLSEIYKILQDADNSILNQNIRLN
jgi:hypothetical protein